MPGHHHSGSFRIGTGDFGIHIAHFVDDGLIAHFPQTAGKILRPLPFVIGGGRDGDDLQLFFQDIAYILFQIIQSLLDLFLPQEFLHIVHVSFSP